MAQLFWYTFAVFVIKYTACVKKCLDVSDFTEKVEQVPEILGEWAMTNYWTDIEAIHPCEGFLNVSTITERDEKYWASRCISDSTLTNLKFVFTVKMPEKFDVPFSLLTFNKNGFSYITNPRCGTYGRVRFWKNGDYYLWIAEDKGKKVPVAIFVPSDETARCIVYKDKGKKADFYQFCAYINNTIKSEKHKRKISL